MATIKNQNWSRQQPVGVNDGDVIEQCNINQAEPDTPICEGMTAGSETIVDEETGEETTVEWGPLTFRNCNLVNCSLPEDAVIESCNTARVDRCYWLHPNWGLEEEPEDCPHVVEVEEIYDGNTLIDTIYHREDTVL